MKCYLLICGVLFSFSVARGLDLLSIAQFPQTSTTLSSDFSSQDNRSVAILNAISQFDESWEKNRPHEARAHLKRAVEQCEFLLKSSGFDKTTNNLDRVRLAYACLVAESEWLSRSSPWKQFQSSNRLEDYSQFISNTEIPVSERLYAEGRIYSALPRFYGQNIKKALVSLEMLKRRETNPKLTEPWIERIRRGQGKWPPENTETNDKKNPSMMDRKETDGLGVGLYPAVYGGFPQGIGLQLLGQDSALWDTQRRALGRVFATYRGSFGLTGKYEDEQSIEGLKLLASIQYLHGIQEYHGLGINAPKGSLDLFIDKGVSDLLIQKNIFGQWYLRLGWRFHSSHLRKTEGGILEPGLIGISNAFDSGALLEWGYDSRDSEFDPYRGQRFLIQSYIPRQGWGSSRSFERFLFLGESFWPLSNNWFLKTQGFYVSVSEAAPFYWYSALSGSIPFAGLRPTRYLDRSLIAAAGELRWKGWSAMTLLTYLNGATLSDKTETLGSQQKKVGLGLGAELYLSRFRNRTFRAEAGVFGGEWSFNTMVGVPID